MLKPVVKSLAYCLVSFLLLLMHVSCIKEPEIIVTDISLSSETLQLTVGDNYQLTATVEPENAVDKTVVWGTSNAAVATIEDGLVTAVAEGEAVIKATAGGKEAICQVTVAKQTIPVTGISLDHTELELVEGDTFTLIATIEPEDATDKTVVWTSSDDTVVNVEDGVITAVGAGTATITVSATGTEMVSTCEVSVDHNPDGIIEFADPKVKEILVANFDTNADGCLSYREAAAVTSLDGVFGDRKDFTSFDEFQFFIGIDSIQDYQFKEWTLSSITLPNSITAIGNSAFQECRLLEKIILPERLYSIGDCAFHLCRSLTSINIPEFVSIIEGWAFSGCTKLKKFTGTYASSDGRLLIKDGVLLAFAPAGLGYYTIPAGSVTKIGDGAFYACKSLYSIKIPEGVLSIGKQAFRFCSGLTSVDLPESITTIGREAFEYCWGLTYFHIPSNVISIGYGAFADNRLVSFTGKYSCDNGTLLVIDNQLVAFAYQKGNYSYSIPDGITTIKAFSLSYLKLSYITIPSSVNKIETAAFFDGTNWEAITFLGANPPEGSAYMFDFTNDCSIYVPKQSEEAYKQAPYWRDYADRISRQGPSVPPVVDLGLSVKWAVKNVGAGDASDYGSYFAWGELDTKLRYEGETYQLGTYSNGILNMNYYNSRDGWTRLYLNDDVAHACYGGKWRMPTLDEYIELINNCTLVKTTLSGVAGIELTSKINGNSIFFPFAGLIDGSRKYYEGTLLYYWTSTKGLDDWCATSFAFLNETPRLITNKPRVQGMPVRAVLEK